MTVSLPSITAASLATLCRQGYVPVLLDVRSRSEFRQCRIPGALLVPLDRLDTEVFVAEHGAHTPCTVICRSGRRAARATARLIDAGMTTVWVLEGGINAWIAAGLPVDRGSGTSDSGFSVERQTRILSGLGVLLGWALGYWQLPAWYGLCAVMGASLVMCGLSDVCLVSRILERMPWNRRHKVRR
jgi:rhodanese-related sulfurtransferase